MFEGLAAQLTNPATLVAVLVALAVFATLYTLLLPIWRDPACKSA